jgi:hypothetical protein
LCERQTAGDAATISQVRSLAQAIYARIADVHSRAALARSQLEQHRADARSITADASALIDALAADVDAAEQLKVSALEKEAVDADNALELLLRSGSEAGRAVSCAEDAGPGQLGGHEKNPRRLPTAPIEPADIFISPPDEASTAAGGGALNAGCVVHAPRGVRAADVTAAGLASRVGLGRPLCFSLQLSDAHPSHAAADLAVSLAALAAHVNVVALLLAVEGDGLPRSSPASASFSQLLTMTARPDPAHRRVVVSLELPLARPVIDGSVKLAVEIHSISVANERVAVDPSSTAFSRGSSGGGEGSGAGFTPLCIEVYSGIVPPFTTAPRTADSSNTTIAVTAQGVLYVPVDSQEEMTVWDPRGCALPPLAVSRFGFQHVRTVAFCDATDTLFVTNTATLVAASAAADYAVLWSVPVRRCIGLTVLPAEGLVIAGSYQGSIVAHRVSDGCVVGAAEGATDTVFVAADTSCACIYVSSQTRVAAYSWHGSSGGFGPREEVDAAGDTHDNRPLAVMPAAPGKRNSYLVVGTSNRPELKILSLPDRRLFCTVNLQDALGLDTVKVLGLAADPGGCALAMCDEEATAVRVVPWPLPGMPELD